MEKRPYISADAFFDSLPPERQAKILADVDEIITDNTAATDRPYIPAHKGFEDLPARQQTEILRGVKDIIAGYMPEDKRTDVSAEALDIFFETLSEDMQEKVWGELDVFIADSMSRMSAQPARKAVGLETSRQVKTSKPMPVAK
ncbi:MAG: hypothetical protein MJE68_33185 [Proteobacteria bacterium]|nr:hypothetical protein [Pseudomonadota bacterium]